MLVMIGLALTVIGIVFPIFAIRAAVNDYYSIGSMVNIVFDAIKEQRLPNKVIPTSAVVWTILAVAVFVAACICFMAGSNIRIKNKVRARSMERARAFLAGGCLIGGVSYPVMLLMKTLTNVEILYYYRNYDLFCTIGTVTMIVGIVGALFFVFGLINVFRNM